MSLHSHPPGIENRKRNKRATVVCTRCHDKKVVPGQLQERCSGCVEAFAECRYRPSQRGTVRRRDRKAAPTHVTDSVDPVLPPGDRPNVLPPSTSGPSPALDSRNGGRVNHAQADIDAWSSAIHDQPSQTSHSREPVAEPIVDGRNPSQAIVTPGQLSLSSQGNSHRAAYLGESGYMSIFRHELAEDDAEDSQENAADLQSTHLMPVLQESYLDTYFEYCHTWCPILDRETMQTCLEFSESQLLREALAVLGSQLSPPLIRHPKPIQHFQRFRKLFYDNNESQPLVRICAVMLLYWWSSGPPNVVSIDTNWWWMGASIRLAQEIGLHREQNTEHVLRPGETNGLRRRIWWTLFARDRLTALMQARPCAIDPDYSDLRMASVEDFPDPNDPKAEIWVHWVRLCEIIGRVGKAIAQGKIHEPGSTPANDLMNWPQDLPDHLQLPISDDRTVNFNRDVHMLHLPYLATTILLHLQKTTDKLPRASMTAIIAASCVSRTLQDILARGTLRYLPGQTGWYISISIIALLYARSIEALTTHADAEISILLAALKQMALLWHSSKMFFTGFQRILETDRTHIQPSFGLGNAVGHPEVVDQTQASPTLNDITATADSSWRQRFPYVTMNTSPLTAALLEDTVNIPFMGMESSQVNYLFDFLDDLDPDILQMDLSL
ncbi:hypothetical protein Z517_11970 [Fonsecaea pedrosoi CBS 271.37]|uniref:Xylanolytic transcriptional activator regulatory domain-containing protein n=1 Tax=Fonsecaea pedrosoi CBS 271.37 TaxID=1442368 RepID=A0A0D2EL98_9EURO|nr:uncharacterized protein Z517_11970 [Fonsecaea pedrosoi CBS 271.37]KIW75197.1 hypothetical protein Z517_11970 [Fonsecaea pedrosoi CBS 271.37]